MPSPVLTHPPLYGTTPWCRAREELFKGDAEMLDISRTKALAEFRANRDLTDEDDIEHAIKVGIQCPCM